MGIFADAEIASRRNAYEAEAFIRAVGECVLRDEMRMSDAKARKQASDERFSALTKSLAEAKSVRQAMDEWARARESVSALTARIPETEALKARLENARRAENAQGAQNRADEARKAKNDAEKELALARKEEIARSGEIPAWDARLCENGKKKSEMDEVLNRLSKIRGQLAQYLLMNQAKQELADRKKTRMAAQEALASAEKALTRDEERAKELNRQTQALSKAQALLEQAKAERKALEERRNRLRALYNVLKELKTEGEALKDAQKRARQAAEKYALSQNAHAEKLQFFLLSQAGVLAEGLKPGKACPVCGSTEHPSPARRAESAPTQAEVDALGEEARKAAEQAQTISGEAARLNGSYQEKRKTAEAEFKALIENGEAQSLPEYERRIPTVLQLHPGKRVCLWFWPWLWFWA